MVSRTNTGFSGGALLMAAAALAASWCPLLAVAFAGCAVLFVAGSVAHKTPLLHKLPLIGAPKLKTTFVTESRWDMLPNTVLLQVGIKTRTRLDDATVSLLLPADVKFYPTYPDGSERTDVQWIKMPLTTEELEPGKLTAYRVANVDIRRGDGLLYFAVAPPELKPRRVRLKVDSEKLYEEYVADGEVAPPGRVEREPPDWRSRGTFQRDQAQSLESLEDGWRGYLSTLQAERRPEARDQYREAVESLERQIVLDSDPRQGHRRALAKVIEDAEYTIRHGNASVAPLQAESGRVAAALLQNAERWVAWAKRVIDLGFPEWADLFHHDDVLASGDEPSVRAWYEKRVAELREIHRRDAGS